jgi:hypothetical protein
MDIFRDPSKSLPKKDEQIVRVDFEEQQIGARKSHMPKSMTADRMAINHVPNAGSKH